MTPPGHGLCDDSRHPNFLMCGFTTPAYCVRLNKGHMLSAALVVSVFEDCNAI